LYLPKYNRRVNLLVKYPSPKKALSNYRIKQRFNCGHSRKPSPWHPTIVYNWDIHETDEMIEYPPPTSYYVHACDLIEVYQERKSIKRYYIIKGESLPITHILSG